VKFEPISYDHAARLINQRPWNVSRNGKLLVEAHETAIKTYKSSECIVGVDIYNIEIEAYGCEIIEPDGNGIPTAGTHPFDKVSDLIALQLNPAKDGRIPMLLEAAVKISEQNPDVKVRIPIAGPFTIACHLLGMENTLCELIMEPEPVAQALLHLADNQLKLAQVVLDKGIGLTVFDSSVTPPLLSPATFKEWVLPSLDKLLGELPDETRKETQLIIGGDTLHILDSILSLDPAYIICPAETDQEKFMKKIIAHDDMIVRVNMNPSVFLAENIKQAKIEFERIFKLAMYRKKSTIGSLLPFNADSKVVSEITKWTNEAISKIQK